MKRNMLLPSQALGSFERLFQDLTHGIGPGGADGRRFMAAVDLYEHDNGWRLVVDLPGVQLDQVELTLEDGLLEISAERQRQEVEGQTLTFAERAEGRFVRRLRIPGEVDSAAIEARLQDGVLTVELPKAAEARPRRIEIARG